MLLLPVLLKSSSPRVVSSIAFWKLSMGVFIFVNWLQIMMSSGGMLLEKLNAADPQLTKLEPFDGIVAYSQQKVGWDRDFGPGAYIILPHSDKK